MEATDDTSRHSSRNESLRQFVASVLGEETLSVAPASSDASFRSYWRVQSVLPRDHELTGAVLTEARAGTSWIVMDAPPGREDVSPWVDIAWRLRRAGLHAPEIVAVDCAQGFVMMEDLGSRIYLTELNGKTVDGLYHDALDALHRMQTRIDAATLPAFDAAFMTIEMELMPEWFLRRHLGLEPNHRERNVIESAFRAVIATVVAQPQVFMHRDYHSRNLMIISDAPPGDRAVAIPNPGIIDFQDAMAGPVTYDLVSLLRDCYIAWEPERVERWAHAYRQRLREAALINDTVDIRQFGRWFDFTGLQRHLKVLGIFCRLWYRDGKRQYLGDLPLIWRYVMSVVRRYPELAPLAELLDRALGDRDIAQPRESSPSS